MLSNAYFLAKFRFDTAENEPAKNFAKFANFAPSQGWRLEEGWGGPDRARRPEPRPRLRGLPVPRVGRGIRILRE